MNRRQFLDTCLWTTGALCTGLGLSACTSDTSDEVTAGVDTSATASMSLPAIGLQLYTLRSVLETDVRGTLEQVADIGYDEVEFAGYYDRTPDDIRALLDDLGLAAPATHVPLSRIRKQPDEVIRTAKAIGHEYVVCPYLQEEERTPLENYRRLADDFTAFGTRCTEAGLQFAYHNHDFEFTEMDGTLPYNVLLEETDPEHVQMELDLYWVIEAGHDPLAFIERNPERYPLCHVKDRGPDGGMTSVGAGTIDFAAIFRKAQFEHYFVEHDNPDAPMQSIRQSYRALQGLEM
jgi:sugar phosphate isomerase/epimerase